MKNHPVEIEINAKVDQVFHWLNDPDCLLKWIPNLVENEQLISTENKVGSTFRQVYLENGRRMEMTGEVISFEENKTIGCAISGKMFDLEVHYCLEDLGNRTKVVQTSEVKMKGVFKIIGFLMGAFMKKGASKQTAEFFLALKKLVEEDVDFKAC